MAARPVCVQRAIGCGLVVLIAGTRWILGPGLLSSYPFMPFFGAVLVATALFNGRAGLAAMFASVAVIFFELGGLDLTAREAFGLAMFTAISAGGVLGFETLHNSLEQLRESERTRVLLLNEYRHRSRNDLQNLTALLLLRARHAAPEAKAALQEAAQHALGLARVHTRLSAATPGEDDRAVIDTREFLAGLGADLERVAANDGLRPIAIRVDAERHLLSTERGVQLGLVVNETVTNALKYAFPGDTAGTIRVEFRRDASTFELVVTDDGVGIPPGAEILANLRGGGLGSRLLRGLAAQLKGSFERHKLNGYGTVCRLAFPVDEVAVPIPAQFPVAPRPRRF
jgi:two-component sensor histidine kinase